MDRTPAESVVPRMHATGFEFMRLSKEIEGLISNYQRIIDGYLTGVGLDRLAKATKMLGGNSTDKYSSSGWIGRYVRC